MQSLSLVSRVLGALAVLGVTGYLVSLYNSLVQVRNNCSEAWKDIDVLLQQRHDELPKLVAACKGYITHEKSLLESLTRLRTRYDGAAGPGERTAIENEINRATAPLRMSWEAYPTLKASDTFLQIQQRISGLEASIADRRELYNHTINIYNTEIERFPAVLVARMLGYSRQPFLEIPEERKQDVTIDFLAEVGAGQG